MKRWCAAFVLLFLVAMIFLELLFIALIDPVTRSMPIVRTAQSSIEVVSSLLAAVVGASLYVRLSL